MIKIRPIKLEGKSRSFKHLVAYWW